MFQSETPILQTSSGYHCLLSSLFHLWSLWVFGALTRMFQLHFITLLGWWIKSHHRNTNGNELKYLLLILLEKSHVLSVFLLSLYTFSALWKSSNSIKDHTFFNTRPHLKIETRITWLWIHTQENFQRNPDSKCGDRFISFKIQMGG